MDAAPSGLGRSVVKGLFLSAAKGLLCGCGMHNSI